LVEVPFDEEHEFGDPYDFIDLMVGGHAEFPASSRDVSHMYFVQSESRCVIKKNVLTRETLEDTEHHAAIYHAIMGVSSRTLCYTRAHVSQWQKMARNGTSHDDSLCVQGLALS
jgi:hypothetical protein